MYVYVYIYTYMYREGYVRLAQGYIGQNGCSTANPFGTTRLLPSITCGPSKSDPHLTGGSRSLEKYILRGPCHPVTVAVRDYTDYIRVLLDS